MKKGSQTLSNHVKQGDMVKIISGKDKGKTGEILEINRKLNKIKVKAINMVKKHTKPTKENKGGIISKESFIHQSNVKNIDIKQILKDSFVYIYVFDDGNVEVLTYQDNHVYLISKDLNVNNKMAVEYLMEKEEIEQDKE